MSSRSTKAFRGALASFIQYGVFIILQIILAPLVLRVAGQEVLGAYSIIMQIIGYGILLDLGFSVALSRYLSQAYGPGDKDKLFSEIFTIGRVVLLATNVIFSLLILVVATNINSIVDLSESIAFQARISLYLLAAWTVLRTPLALYNQGLMATQNMGIANLIATFGNAGRLILSLVFVYLGYGLIGLIFANILSEWVQYIFQMKYFKSLYPSYSFGWKISNVKLFKEILNFGVKYWGVNFAGVLFLGSDIIIVGNLYGADAASIFYTTKIPAFLLFQFIFRVSDNAAPAVNELYAQGNLDAVRSAYLRILRYSLFLAMPIALGVVCFNKGVITLWVGSAQYAGELMSIAIGIFIVSQVINHTNAMIALATGEMKFWSLFSIITGIISLLLSYSLGYFYGIQWVMVSIAIMDIPNTIFLFNKSILGLKIRFQCIWNDAIKPAIRSCIPLGFFTIYLLINSFEFEFVNLILYTSAFLIIMIGSLVLIGLTNDEKIYIRNKCKIYRS
jgi:O-antigen/teichoic acid export membrane protein